MNKIKKKYIYIDVGKGEAKWQQKERKTKQNPVLPGTFWCYYLLENQVNYCEGKCCLSLWLQRSSCPVVYRKYSHYILVRTYIFEITMHMKDIYLTTNVEKQTVFRAGSDGHSDEEERRLCINNDFTVSGAFIVIRIYWTDISAWQEEKDRTWGLKITSWHQKLGWDKKHGLDALGIKIIRHGNTLETKFLSAIIIIIIPLARSIQIDLLGILEVIKTDDFVINRGELNAALVHGVVERRWWL